MPPLATLKTWLVEAYAARHALAIGEKEQTLTHTLAGSNTVTFFTTSPEKLDAHILWIEDLIARRQGRGRRCFYIT